VSSIKNFKLDYKWLSALLPEGITVPSSTIITGPGGSGKPIIGCMLVAAWLRQGGTAVIQLINSDRNFLDRIFGICDIDPKAYKGRIYYIDFDPEIETLQPTHDDEIKANLLKPDVWDLAIKEARSNLQQSPMGDFVYGAALNILVFSKTYGRSILQKIKHMLETHANCIFSISNKVFEPEMKQLEEAADNLIFTHNPGAR